MPKSGNKEIAPRSLKMIQGRFLHQRNLEDMATVTIRGLGGEEVERTLNPKP